MQVHHSNSFAILYHHGATSISCTQPTELRSLTAGIRQALSTGLADAVRLARYERLQRASGIIPGFSRSDELSKPTQTGILETVDTFVRGAPTGREVGLATAVEIGGSTVRALPVEFMGRGRPSRVLAPLSECSLAVTPEQKRIPAPELFDLVAGHALAVERKAAAACVREHLPGFEALAPGAGGEDSDRLASASEEEVHRMAAAETAGPAVAVPPTALAFSFPAQQRSLHSALASRLDKGWKTPGLLGADVVRLYQDAVLRAAGAQGEAAGPPPRVPPLVNDCVGTLVLGAYHDPDCRVAVILGTGTNAALFVPRARLWQAGAAASGGPPGAGEAGPVDPYAEGLYRGSRDRKLVLQVAKNSPGDVGAQAAAEVVWEEEEGACGQACGINTEWASYRDRERLPWTCFDDAIEADFEEAGGHPPRRLQSLVSGRYLGEIARRVLQAAVAEGELLAGVPVRRGAPLHAGSRWGGHGGAPFGAADLFSVLHDDPSGAMDAARAVLGRSAGQQAGAAAGVTREDCQAARAVCLGVVRRAARVVAAGVVACAQACELGDSELEGGAPPGVPRRFAVELDGSVFTRNRVFGRTEGLLEMDGLASEVLVGASGDSPGSGAQFSGPAAEGPGMDRLILEAVSEHPDVPPGTVVALSTHREASAKGSALVALREAQ